MGKLWRKTAQKDCTWPQADSEAPFFGRRFFGPAIGPARALRGLAGGGAAQLLSAGRHRAVPRQEI